MKKAKFYVYVRDRDEKTNAMKFSWAERDGYLVPNEENFLLGVYRSPKEIKHTRTIWEFVVVELTTGLSICRYDTRDGAVYDALNAIREKREFILKLCRKQWKEKGYPPNYRANPDDPFVASDEFYELTGDNYGQVCGER